MPDDAPYPLLELLGSPREFGRPWATAVRATGTRILFEDGVWRLCGTSGLWNANLGYGNERIADAVAEALRTASYLTLFRGGHAPAVAAARALLDLADPDHFGRVAFATSGGAGNDMMMKLVRQYWSLHRRYRRHLVVGLRGSYHGLTYGSHALTGMSLAQTYYGVDRGKVRHVGHTDIAELAELLGREGDNVAAVVVEPVLGTGAYRLSEEMVRGLLRLRAEHGFLLVADEVATGFGRTGPCFASLEWPERPDVLVMSKGLTNGTCAAAALLLSREICAVFDRHNAILTHAETQAGHPATCAAILATIEEMRRLDALRRGREVARWLDAFLAGLTTHPLVAGHDGAGCFRGLRLARDGVGLDTAEIGAIVLAIRHAGVVVSSGPGCIQFAPALTYDRADADKLFDTVRAVLDRAVAVLPATAPSGPR